MDREGSSGSLRAGFAALPLLERASPASMARLISDSVAPSAGPSRGWSCLQARPALLSAIGVGACHTPVIHVDAVPEPVYASFLR